MFSYHYIIIYMHAGIWAKSYTKKSRSFGGIHLRVKIKRYQQHMYLQSILYYIYKPQEKKKHIQIIYHYFCGTCLLIFLACSLSLSLSLRYIYICVCVSYYRYGWMCACVFAYGVLISVITNLMCATNFETRRSLRPRLLLKTAICCKHRHAPSRTRV